MDAQEREPADVGVGVEVGHARLQAVAFGVRRRRDRGQERLEQRQQVGAHLVLGQRRPALAGAAIDDRELDLLLVGIEIEEEVVDLRDDFGDARVRAVDLVDHEDDREALRERLAQHEARLRQRTFGGVDQEDYTVDHGQAALDFTAEVGVAGRVDEVQRDLGAVGPDVGDGRVLGEDRDPAFAFLVHRVHDSVGDGLMRGEHAGLTQQSVDEGGLAVVNVRDDGDVSDIGAL